MTQIPRLRAVLALVFAVLAGVVVYGVTQQALTRLSAARPTVGVLVAARDIQIGEALSSALISVTQLPADALPGPAPALEADRAAVVGSIARAPLFAGEVIQRRRLFAPGTARLTDAPDAALVRKGYWLYQISTPSVLNIPGAGLRSGDHVAILATLQEPVRPVTTTLGAATGAASGGGATGRVVQVIDPFALVTYVASPPGGGVALTVAVPRGEAPTLQLLKDDPTVTFGFAQVRPDDAGGALTNTTRALFRRQYHVPSPE